MGPDENNTKSVKLSKQVRKEVLPQNWEFIGSLQPHRRAQIITYIFGPHSSDRGLTKLLETVIKWLLRLMHKTSSQIPELSIINKDLNPSLLWNRNTFKRLKRNKKLINFQSDLNLSANYQKTLLFCS